MTMRLRDHNGLGNPIDFPGCIDAQEHLGSGGPFKRSYTMPDGTIESRIFSGELVLTFEPSSAGQAEMTKLYGIDEGSVITGLLTVPYPGYSVTYDCGYIKHQSSVWLFAYSTIEIS